MEQYTSVNLPISPYIYHTFLLLLKLALIFRCLYPPVYKTDCRYLEAGMEDIQGRENLAVAIKEMSDMGYPVLKEVVFEVLPAGKDFCVERSKWELIKPDGKLGLRGIFICLWEKIGEEWYARMECCNGGSD